jgi:signal transduction histidine kinase
MDYSSRRIMSVGFGLILLVLLFVTVTGLKNMSTINTQMNDVVSVRNVKVDLVAKMRNVARERSLALYHMIMSQDTFVTDAEKIKMSLLAGDFIDARERLFDIGLEEQEQQLLNTALMLASDSSRIQSQVMAHMDKQQYDAATALFIEKSLPAQERLLKQYDVFLNFERSLSVAAANDANATYNTSFITMVLLGSVIILLALAISVYVIRTISRTEKKLHELNQLLENRVEARTIELQRINQELESFSYAVSHDLRAPIQNMIGFSKALLEDYTDKLDAAGKDFLQRLGHAGAKMNELIDALLKLSHLTRAELNMQQANISDLATKIVEEIQSGQPDLHVKFVIEKNLTASFDPSLLHIVLQNLITNAIKFSRTKANPRVEFGALHRPDKTPVFYVRDNGVGFDMRYVDHLFEAFQRLHSHREFEGIGIGLATVARIIHRHHGEIWAEAEVGIRRRG